MTRESFHRLLVDPKTSDWLNRMLAENAKVDDALAALERQRDHDRRFDAGIQAWFRETEVRTR